jgi:hypothetical protein
MIERLFTKNLFPVVEYRAGTGGGGGGQLTAQPILPHYCIVKIIIFTFSKTLFTFTLI